MFDKIFVKNYTAPPVDEREILRYAGVRGETDGGISALLKDCLSESENAFSYRVCYRALEAPSLTEICPYDDLKRRLDGCEYAVAFAATVGLGGDRLISKYAETAPTRALLFQAIGAERIEALCDVFCEEIEKAAKETGYTARLRFSPGYGAFPLEAQKELFSLLDCARKIGLTLNDSLLMTPTKSVTAIVGLGKTAEACKTGCEGCNLSECDFRSIKK